MCCQIQTNDANDRPAQVEETHLLAGGPHPREARLAPEDAGRRLRAVLGGGLPRVLAQADGRRPLDGVRDLGVLCSSVLARLPSPFSLGEP